MYSVFQHHRATEPFPEWVIRDCKKSFKKFCTSVRTNSEIVVSNLDYFAKYAGKTVLIIGGGPSTNNLDIDSVEADYKWSCNHFYLNPKLSETKIDLAMMMGEPNLNCEKFIKYRDTFNPYLGFEVHDRWINYEFDDYKKYFVMHTRFYSKLGIGVRMILFASSIGCKEIKFVGMDGYEPIYKGDHAFQPGKKTLPSTFDQKLYDKQYEEFWKYIRIHFPTTKYTNLGGGEKFHKPIEEDK